MMGPLVLSVVVTVLPPAESRSDAPGDRSTQGADPALVDDPAQGANAIQSAAPVELERSLSEVLASCEKALGAGECTRVEEGDSAWRATVVFLEGGAQVTLSGPNRVIVRSLEFQPEDSEKQRRVAAGLLVAAMTAAARLSEPEPRESTESTESEKEEAVPLPAPQPSPESSASNDETAQDRRSPYSLELSAVFGPTLGGSHFGGGALVGVAAEVARHIGIGAGADGLYSRSDGWQVLQLEAALGPRLGLLPEMDSVSWFLALEGVADYTTVSPVESDEPARSAIRGGGRLRTTVALGSGWVRPLFGLGISAKIPGLEVRQGGASEILVPAFLGSAFLGLLFNSRK